MRPEIRLVLLHDGVRAGPEPLVVSPIVWSAPPYVDSRDRGRRPLEPFVAELHNPVTTPGVLGSCLGDARKQAPAGSATSSPASLASRGCGLPLG